MNLNIIEKPIYILLLLWVQYVTLQPMFLDQAILLSSYTDDFFYYIKIAENLALGEGSTFNGIVQTNGYHPLWLGILFILVKLSFYMDIEVLMFTKVIISLIIFFSFFLFYKFATLYLSNILWRIFFIIFSYWWYARMAYLGMEILITIPLFIAFFIMYLKNKNPLYLGLLASLTILSRLDSIVIFIIFFSVEIYFKGFDTKRFIKLGVGIIPISLYLMSNVYFFNNLMPVSGLAKSVLTITTFHSGTFISLFHLNVTKIFFIFFYIFSIINFTKLKDLTLETKIFYFTAILSVPIYYLQTSLRSDWPLWSWYFYPLVISFIMLSPFINHISINIAIAPKIKKLLFFIIGFTTIVLVIFRLYGISKSNSNLSADIIVKRFAHARPLHLAGIKIAEFEKKNPGIYAMGDRAGVVGYLINSPLIQLEGLVMDKNYLNILEEKDNIEDIFTEYNIDYYIGTNLKKLENNCYMVTEPIHSHGHSRQIKSQLCWEEVLSFKIKTVSTSILQSKKQ